MGDVLSDGRESGVWRALRACSEKYGGWNVLANRRVKQLHLTNAIDAISRETLDAEAQGGVSSDVSGSVTRLAVLVLLLA
jgi:hypothetical protein